MASLSSRVSLLLTTDWYQSSLKQSHGMTDRRVYELPPTVQIYRVKLTLEGPNFIRGKFVWELPVSHTFVYIDLLNASVAYAICVLSVQLLVSWNYLERDFIWITYPAIEKTCTYVLESTFCSKNIHSCERLRFSFFIMFPNWTYSRRIISCVLLLLLFLL